MCDMPNTNPPCVTIAALADKVRRANEIKNFDMRFFFGATETAHVQTLRELLTGTSEELQRLRARCCGLKLYFDHSTGNQKASDEVIEAAFALCAAQKFPIVAHCEDAEMNEKMKSKNLEFHDVSVHSVIRPAESEERAIKYAISLLEKYNASFHVAHLSTAKGLDLVRTAKRKNLPITCEVAPHHLFLTTDDYKTLGTLAKMNPPLRSHDDQRALWDGIKDGTVDCISTDHAPHTLAEKQIVRGAETHGSPLGVLDVPSGVPGVETMLPLLLTVAAGKWPHPDRKFQVPSSKFQVEDIVRLCFANPNRIFHLGKDSTKDQITIDLSKEWVIHGKELHSKCGWTPYENWKVVGRIVD